MTERHDAVLEDYIEGTFDPCCYSYIRTYLSMMAQDTVDNGYIDLSRMKNIRNWLKGSRDLVLATDLRIILSRIHFPTCGVKGLLIPGRQRGATFRYIWRKTRTDLKREAKMLPRDRLEIDKQPYYLG